MPRIRRTFGLDFKVAAVRPDHFTVAAVHPDHRGERGAARCAICEMGSRLLHSTPEPNRRSSDDQEGNSLVEVCSSLSTDTEWRLGAR
jgi:hypothetical protein